MANNLFISFIFVFNKIIIYNNKSFMYNLKYYSSYLYNKTDSKELTLYGTNLLCTVGYPYYTKKIRYLIDIPENIMKPLVGIILSDGSITVNNNSIYKENARFRFKQSMKQIEYVHLVFQIMGHYCSSYPHYIKGRLNRKDFYGIEIVSRALPCFLNLRDKFYKRGKKIVPHDLFDILTYEGLAHWIMSDGSFVKGGGLYLNTQSFTVLECVLIINVLIIKFDLSTTLQMQRNKPIIYFKVNSVKKLYPNIQNYIIKSMEYKFHYKLIMKDKENIEISKLGANSGKVL